MYYIRVSQIHIHRFSPMLIVGHREQSSRPNHAILVIVICHNSMRMINFQSIPHSNNLEYSNSMSYGITTTMLYHKNQIVNAHWMWNQFTFLQIIWIAYGLVNKQRIWVGKREMRSYNGWTLYIQLCECIYMYTESYLEIHAYKLNPFVQCQLSIKFDDLKQRHTLNIIGIYWTVVFFVYLTRYFEYTLLYLSITSMYHSTSPSLSPCALSLLLCFSLGTFALRLTAVSSLAHHRQMTLAMEFRITIWDNGKILEVTSEGIETFTFGLCRLQYEKLSTANRLWCFSFHQLVYHKSHICMENGKKIVKHIWLIHLKCVFVV